MRNVLVMHSFCELAHALIGCKLVEISFADFDMDKIEIEENTIDNVLKPEKITYLFLSNNSLSISLKDYLIKTILVI